MTLFYTYAYLRADATPYYVGKGTGTRVFDKRRSTHMPSERARVLVQYWPSEEKAFEIEKYYIRLFGRKDNGTGILRNLTDGGEGTSGRVGGMLGKKHTSLTIERMRKSHSRVVYAADFGNRVSLGKTGKPKRAPYKCPSRQGKPWSTARRDAQNRRAQ